MQVPLIVNAVIKDEKQILEIWRDGKKEQIKPPFLPYMYGRKPLYFNHPPVTIEDCVMKALSSLEERRFWKYSFQNTHFISRLNQSIEHAGISMEKMSRLVVENHTEFRERIIIDEPDFFRGYPQIEDLKPFFFDIETGTKDGVDLHFISSIAYAGPDRIIKSKQIPIFQKENTYYVNPQDEKDLIIWFFQSILDEDPDIIVGYYMRDFDLTYIFERAIVHNINYQIIGRDKSVTFYNEGKKVKMSIGGRILYDILDSVWSDQTLYGIKNRKMKTVAKWMKFEDIVEEDTSSTVNIAQEDLKKYNESDVRLTYQMYDVYFLNNQILAEMFGIPLNMVLESSSSFIANIFQGQGIHAANIVSDGMNQDRHPEIYRRRKQKDQSNYQAAYVDIYKKGRFDKVWKVDYKGLYNAIEITVNASPDTTRIIRYDSFDENGFKFEKHGNYINYYIPDNQINKTVVVEVNYEFDGILRKELKKIREARSEVKLKMKTCTKEEMPRLESQQWALKVAANIPSGYNGQAICRWGDIAVSILTVGIGRILIKDTIDHINEKYGDICIEVDTDGVYLSDHVDIDYLNEYLNRMVLKMFGVANELELELEEFNQGYFIKMKNYILYSTEGDLIIHGASLKSSQQPGCFDKSLEKIAECALLDNHDIKSVIREVLDIEKYSLGDLTKRFTLGKPPQTYADTSFWGKLIKQANLIGITPQEGSQIEYIKTDKYQLSSTVSSMREVNIAYYQNIISNLIENFGFKQELKTKDIEDMGEWY